MSLLFVVPTLGQRPDYLERSLQSIVDQQQVGLDLVLVAAGVEPRLVHIASDWLVARHPAFEGTLLGDKAHSAVFDNAKIKRFVPDFVSTLI